VSKEDEGPIDRIKRRAKKAAYAVTGGAEEDKEPSDRVPPSKAWTGAELTGKAEGTTEGRERPAVVEEEGREERPEKTKE
jgi:hypothetical protein